MVKYEKQRIYFNEKDFIEINVEILSRREKLFRNILNKKNKLDKLLYYTENQEVKMFYEFLKKEYSISKVYYPACGVDITPAMVFDEVIMLDNDKSVFNNIRIQNGGPFLRKKLNKMRLIVSDYKNFKPPEDIQLVIGINSFSNISDLHNLIPKGVYIIANNHFYLANNINKAVKKRDYDYIGLLTETGINESSYEETLKFVKNESYWLFKKL